MLKCTHRQLGAIRVLVKLMVLKIGGHVIIVSASMPVLLSSFSGNIFSSLSWTDGFHYRSPHIGVGGMARLTGRLSVRLWCLSPDSLTLVGSVWELKSLHGTTDSFQMGKNRKSLTVSRQKWIVWLDKRPDGVDGLQESAFDWLCSIYWTIVVAWGLEFPLVHG